MQLVVQPDDVHVAASPGQVWDVLADFDAHPQWSPTFRLRGASAAEGSRVTVVASIVPGPPVVLPAVVLRSERGRVLSWGGRVPGLLRLEHFFEFRPVGDGTRITHMETFDGPSVAALKPFASRLRREYALLSDRLRIRAESRAA
jgi:hypothetical protein